LLFLDLDETLIHTAFLEGDQKVRFVFTQPVVYYRPHLDYFLKEMVKKFNLVLFTASFREYAEKILNKIDSESKYIQNVLARENCTKYQNNCIKDFRIVANKNISREDMLILDNKVISFAYNLYQGIPILPYTNDERDTELLNIVPFLSQLADKTIPLKEILKERYNYSRYNNLHFDNSIC
jgi:Dullard-like phosphatase family protein